MVPGFGEFVPIDYTVPEHPPEYYESLVKSKNNYVPFLLNHYVFSFDFIEQVPVHRIQRVQKTITKMRHGIFDPNAFRFTNIAEYIQNIALPEYIGKRQQKKSDKESLNRLITSLCVYSFCGLGAAVTLIYTVEKHKLHKMANTASCIIAIAGAILLIYIRMQPEPRLLESKEELLRRYFYERRKEIEYRYKRDNISFEQMKRDFCLE